MSIPTIRQSTPSGLIAQATLLAVLAAPAAAQQPLFDAALVVADKTHRFEAVLDLDADGFADALSWYWTDDVNFSGAQVSGWLNDGTGALAPAWSLAVQPIFEAQEYSLALTATGDLDGDAREDFAVAFGADVHLWSSNGASLPTELSVVSNPDPVLSIVLGDFDGDGLSDLAAADDLKVRVWTNAGANRWLQTELFSTFGPPPDTLLALDADGDGDDDVVDLYGSEVDLYLMQDGELAGVTGVLHGLTNAGSVVLAKGDVDADGDTDLVVFDNAAGTCAVMRYDGGTFAPGTSQPGGPATHLFDVTGDGAADGVCCSSGGYNPPKSTDPSQFEVAVNDGTGDFAAAFAIPSLGASHLAGVADLDHDGDADLVAGRTIYRARAPLTAAVHATFEANEGLIEWGATPSMVFDADGDGDPDVRFGTPQMQANDGAGAFATVPVTFPPVPELKKWQGPGFPGDFDGDGDTDVVVSRWKGLFSAPTFLDNYLLRNAGGGLLWTATPATATPVNMSGVGVNIDNWDEPAASIAADADADGDTDLFVRAGVNGGPTTLWINDGNGLFTQGTTWTDTLQAVALLDGGALPDLVFAADAQVVVRLGLGGGAFGGPKVLASAVGFKDGLGVLDVDGDADLDVVAGPDFGASIDAWINDGAGNFTLDQALLSDVPFFVSTSVPDRFVVADVDGDGQQDLLAGPVSGAVTTTWLLLRKQGAPGFESAGQYCMRIVSAADMDGDGDADLLGQEGSTDDVIVDGLRFDGPAAGTRWQYGTGTAGTGGAVPVLGASGPFRVGETVTLRFAGLPSLQLGLLTVGLSQTNLPGTPWLGSTAYNWPWIVFFFIVSPPGEPGVPGSSELALPFVVPSDLPLVGPLYHQVWFADPGAPYGRVGSNGLLIEYE